MIGWFTLSMQETNQWATDCSLSLRDGPWQKKIKKYNTKKSSCRALQCVGPPGKCPVCPITSPALGGMEAQVSLTVAFSSSAFFGLLFLIFLLTIRSGLVSLLASQAHQHHGNLTNFWCFWQCGQVPNPAGK